MEQSESDHRLSKPMKLDLYNAIVEDFNKLKCYSRTAENVLRKKYDQ